MKFQLVILLAIISTCPALCPTKCTCTQDQKNRKTVLCKDGGLIGPLTLQNVSEDTQILKITAPDDNSNMLTMSPVFHSFKQLEEIHITKSNIPQLGKHFFYGLTRLDVLNLSQNNITQPLDHNFRGLDKLKQLLLDDNRIQSLPSGTFRFLHGLKVLSIQRNRITELANRIFLEIGNLTVLKLSGNDLRQLNSEVFSDVQKLRRLECRGCNLRKLHKEIYHFLPHLTYLDLGDNDIMNLHTDDLKDLTNLEHLKLDGNQLLILHDNTFVNQIFLRELDVSRNALTKIAANAFVELYNLTELNLSRNKLGKIHEGAFNYIVGTLEKLDLSGNQLKQHTLKELSCLKFLKELKLSQCGLVETDPKMFPPNLEKLDLSGNFITTINAEHLPTQLDQLDISKNKIRGISEANLIRLDLLSSLNLVDNPWSCDLCYIVPLLERANRSHTFSQVICASPFTMRNKSLGMLEKSQLTWCTAASHSAGDADFFLISQDGKIGIIAASMSVCLLLLTIAAIIGALCYSRRHAAKYYTHEDKLDSEGDNMFQNHSPLFCDGELSFKFPLDAEKKVSIATIEEMSNGHQMLNGT
ncbi:toll-like receptor Tollo [Anthonomus grandis grandis]|uniref:toll-like receptor Tollo n=1 Tax=Anthonomus grandis grandis TaxID=2921223 RepID=UPI002165F269|nr:toll-like receptor Tollo [Anthonomus grandis grandis]